MELSKLLADEAKIAFSRMASEYSDVELCGFALYSDDSAQWVDIAANTKQHLNVRIGELKETKYRASEEFAQKWYTTEWSFEGGYADCFSAFDNAIAELVSNVGEEQVRLAVIEAMVDALKALRDESFFESLVASSHFIVLTSLTDSEDDEDLMERSVKLLNPNEVYSEFVREKENAGI